MSHTEGHSYAANVASPHGPSETVPSPPSQSSPIVQQQSLGIIKCDICLQEFKYKSEKAKKKAQQDKGIHVRDLGKRSLLVDRKGFQKFVKACGLQEVDKQNLGAVFPTLCKNLHDNPKGFKSAIRHVFANLLEGNRIFEGAYRDAMSGANPTTLAKDLRGDDNARPNKTKEAVNCNAFIMHCLLFSDHVQRPDTALQLENTGLGPGNSSSMTPSLGPAFQLGDPEMVTDMETYDHVAGNPDDDYNTATDFVAVVGGLDPSFDIRVFDYDACAQPVTDGMDTT